MISIETAILVTGVLLLAGIAASRISAKLGVPALLLFLAVGMLAGSEGLGGIEFDSPALMIPSNKFRPPTARLTTNNNTLAAMSPMRVRCMVKWRV